MLGCWITRVGVRCYVGCWKPNDLTRVGLILTCWNSNACWTENVSVIVRFKDVLFCSMLDTYILWLAGWPAGRHDFTSFDFVRKKSFETFAGVQGTPVYEAFKAGNLHYHRYLMVKSE